MASTESPNIFTQLADEFEESECNRLLSEGTLSPLQPFNTIKLQILPKDDVVVENIEGTKDDVKNKIKFDLLDKQIRKKLGKTFDYRLFNGPKGSKTPVDKKDVAEGAHIIVEEKANIEIRVKCQLTIKVTGEF
jgi:hypothetical protein